MESLGSMRGRAPSVRYALAPASKMAGRRGAPGVNVSQRRKARRVLVQALYQWQMNRTTARLLTAEYTGSGALDKADQPFFDDMLGRVLASPSQLDELYDDLLDRDRSASTASNSPSCAWAPANCATGPTCPPGW